MIIALKGNKKKKIGVDFFFEDFLTHIKTLKIKLNYGNINLIKKIEFLYLNLCNGDDYIKSRELKKIINKHLGISHNVYSREGLIERGFSDDEIKKLYSINGNNRKETHKNKINQINATTYHFGKFSFHLEEKPKCKICGSELEFRLTKNNELEILKCKNDKCSSKKGIKNKHKAFLPDYLEKEYYKEKKKCSKRCVEYWLNKGFTEKEAKEKISEIQSAIGKLNKGKTKIIDKNYIQSIGLDSKTFFKERSVFCVEYWKKRGYSEEDAKKIISERQSILAKKNAARGKDALKKSSVRCIEYWINKGYDENESKEKVSIVQSTFSLEKCIAKYGQEKGEKIWKERQVKWQDSLNKKGFHQLGYSPISQELFEAIEKNYPKEEKDFLFYEKKNREYTLKNNNGYYYRYDFCDLNKRKFIEFNGDIYHGNPKLFKPTDKPNPFHNKTAKELWDIDEDKKKIATKNGFSEFVVWEKDYKENKEKIINECLNFLKNE